MKQYKTYQNDQKKRGDLINQKQKQLEKHEKALMRAKISYEEDDNFKFDEYLETKNRRQPEIDILKKEIIELEHENVVRIYTEKEIEQKLALFKDKWNSGLSDSEINTLLKSIVKRIYYDRDMDNITFEVEYL